jgi:hypothetical protein
MQYLRSAALLFFLLFVPHILGAQEGPSLVQQLSRDLVGKTFLLRHLPASEHLQSDASGELQGDPGSTSWTLANIHVSEVRSDPAGILLRGKRVIWIYNTWGTGYLLRIQGARWRCW